jgi:hypothetical protein
MLVAKVVGSNLGTKDSFRGYSNTGPLLGRIIAAISPFL